MALAQVGGTTYSALGANETKIQALGAGSYLAFNFSCFNPDASATTYVQFFDALIADVNLGTTAPKFVLALPPKGGVDGGFNLPRAFHTAIAYAVTATAGGSGAPASAAIVQFDYVSG